MNNERIRSTVLNYPLIFISIMLFLVFAVLNDNYLTRANMLMILRQASLLALLGMGQTIILLSGNIDLSIGSMIALSTVIYAPLLKSEVSFVYPVLLILSTGMALGLMTGLIITKLKIHPFIATFATNYIYRGTAWLLMGNMIIYDFPGDFRFIGKGRILGIPVTIVFMVAICAILYILLTKTTWGRRIYFVGSNIKAARYSGVKVNHTIISAYIVGSLICAFAGVVYLARLNAAEPGIGSDYALNSIAVSLIGGTSIRGGKGRIVGTIIGAVIISTIKNGMNFLQVSSDLQYLYLGLIIVLAVYMNQFVERSRENSQKY